ncbi:type II secretion system F family protein [Roseospira navarrensis]|uniref:Type II secretion system F family protein n=1 Tax=Roseospira navarrensis TaxID=140058 RepID=A0A7X1ZCX3_9PROT|nr:type II secretion system F family protein [Roseospira navarrensis]MQX36027.1 type II secretion system F family protein [Roseospira navarrensis]
METTFLGIPVVQIISVLSFVAAFATVVVIALPFLQRDHKAARLRTISRAREELGRQQREAAERRVGARWRPKRSVNLMRRIVERLDLERLISPKGLKQMLSRAGYRQPYAPQIFVGLRVVLAVGLLLGALFYLNVVIQTELAVVQRFAILIAAPIVGFYLPQILVKNAVTKRQKEMQLNFPDALDLLVISSEAGLSIEAAFQRVTNEIEDSSPILSEEFGLTTAELAFLGDRRRAYINLAERTGLPSAKSLAVTLVQSEKYGTSVSQALKVLSQENRAERLSMAERKAAALPAKLTVPMIVFFLPVLMVVIMGPAIIKINEL